MYLSRPVALKILEDLKSSFDTVPGYNLESILRISKTRQITYTLKLNSNIQESYSVLVSYLEDWNSEDNWKKKYKNTRGFIELIESEFRRFERISEMLTDDGSDYFRKLPE